MIDLPPSVLVVRGEPGDSAIVFFSSVNSNGFSFFRQTAGLRAHRIYVRDPYDAWYQKGIAETVPSVEAVADLLRGVVSDLRPARTATFGTSMGGYASVLFGNLIGVDTVIASSPQTLIDARLPHTPAQDFSASPTFDLADLIADNAPLRRHWISFGCADFVDIYNSIRVPWPTARLYPVANEDHLVAVGLARTGAFQRLFDAALAGEEAPDLAVTLDARLADETLAVLVRRFVETAYLAAPGDRLAILAALLERDETWPATHHALAWCLNRDRRPEEAAVHAMRAAELAPQSVTIASDLAAILQRLGRTDEAIAAYGRCLKLRPRHYAALVSLAQLHHERGEAETALRYIDMAVDVRPRLARGHAVRRMILGEATGAPPPAGEPEDM